MSDKENFDEYLKRSFSDYSPGVPEHIWENIAAEKKKRRPVGFWINNKYLLAGAGLLLAAAVAGVLFNQHKESKTINAETVAVAGKTPSVKEQSFIENTAAGRVKDNDITVTTSADKESERTPADSPVERAGVLAGSKGKAEEPRAGKNSNGVKPYRKGAGNHVSMEQSTFKNLTKAKWQRRDRPGGIFTERSSSTVDIESPRTGQANVTDQINSADVAVPLVDGSRAPLSLLHVSLSGRQPIVFKAIKFPDCPEAEKNAAGNKSYFEVYAGPDYAFKKYSDTGVSVLAAKRKESMRFQSAYSAGLRYTRVFANGMSIRAGINFSQINEKFSFIKDNVVQLVYVINTAGDTTDRYYVRGTRYNNSYNRYRTIDVPVVIGYELGNGRLHANINAGVMLNVYSWQNGETLDSNYMPVSITTGKGGNAAYQYKTNIGVGFTGAVSFYYKINDRLHLLAEPYGRFNLSPMNTAAASLQEKFTSIGLRLGLRVDF